MNTKAYKYTVCLEQAGKSLSAICKCVKNFKLVWEDEEKSGGGADIYFEGWTIQMKAEHIAFSPAILRGIQISEDEGTTSVFIAEVTLNRISSDGEGSLTSFIFIPPFGVPF